MAEVLVQISGVLYDKLSRTERPVLLQGAGSLVGLGVGGGPIIPPEGGGGPPDHIWGPTDPRPTPPIALPPGYPGSPPGIWGPTDPRPTPPIYLPPVLPGGPPINIGAHPEHPIVLPPAPPDTTPSPPDVAVKPPPDDGGWAYVSTWGWGYFPKGGSSGPKG